MDNRRKIGNNYEQKAAEYLKQQGFVVIGQNFYSRWGEIDIIARDGKYLVFAEVKYRKDNSCGSPLEAVDAKKQRRICKAASYFCIKNGYGDMTPCRFDVIAMTGNDEIVHIKNAFDYKV